MVEGVPVVVSSVQFGKFRERRGLSVDELVGLLRVIKGCVASVGNGSR